MLKKPLSSKDSAPLKAAEDERKISWADLTDDDDAKQNTSALRLTYTRWKRKFKGGDKATPPALGAAELDSSASLGNEIDVTTLVRRKKNGGKENEKEPQPQARWMVEHSDPSLSAPPRGGLVSDCVEELAPEDLNLLVTTLTALSKSLGGFQTAGEDTSKDDSGGPATPEEAPPPAFTKPTESAAPTEPWGFVEYPDPRLNWQWQPGNWLAAQPSLEDVLVVGGLSLRTWRSHLMALAYADPQTLATRLQSGLARDLLQGLELPRSRSLSTPVACPAPPPPPPALFPVQSAKPTGVRRRTQPAPAPPERPPPSEGRFKQIARCKSTPEYLLYVERVPRDQRRPEDPATPRVAGSSWREFSAEVRQWKIQLHRKAEALQAAS